MWPFKNKESDTIEVGWVPLCNKFPVAVVYPPEPFRYETDLSAPDFLRCPSIQDHIKGLYVLRTPIDFKVEAIQDGIKVSTTPPQYIEGISQNILFNARMEKYPMIQMPMDIGFVSDTPDVMLELVSIPLGQNQGHSFVVGSLNIHDWPGRTLSASYEWYDQSKPISYKRGDALFCIRITHPSKKKIVLRQCQMTDDLRKAGYDISVINNGFRSGTRAMIKNYSKLRVKKLLTWL